MKITLKPHGWSPRAEVQLFALRPSRLDPVQAVPLNPLTQCSINP